MQTSTFTQKLLQQRSFLRSLIPLFALFIGLGASQSALAQGTVGNSNIFVKIAPSTTNSVYGGSSTVTPKFDGSTLGAFDINTPNALLLNGGEIDATAGAQTPVSAVLTYQLFDNTAPNYTLVGGQQTITLPLVSGSTYKFSESNAMRDLAALVPSAGSYGVDVQFIVTYTGRKQTVSDPTSGSYTSLFTVTGVRPPPSTVTFSGESVTVNQGATDNNYPGAAFNTNLIDQKSGSTSTPAFDINAGQLILKGGTLTTTETGAYVVNGANLDYTLFTSNNAPVTNGTLQLTPGTVNGGVRQFSLGSGTTNLINLIANAGAGYKIQVRFHATYTDAATNNPDVANDLNKYTATFDVTGTKTPAPTVQANTIGIAPNGNATVTYNINPVGTRNFPGADLSDAANNGTAYDLSKGQLRLNATTVTTTEAGANTITNVVLYYRTRLNGSPGGAFQATNLTQSSNVNGVRTFILDPGPLNSDGQGPNAQPNLIATSAVTAAGTYLVDVYYQASGTNSITGNFTITDPNGAPSNVYSASFTVTGTPVVQTIWTGSLNDNWFDPLNWSNGVPSPTKNALIRDLGAGNGFPYPNINSDVVTPTYNNTMSGPAKCLNLIMAGSSQGSRSITRLVRGQLQVYGNFDNSYDSFIQRENTLMEFAGVNQTITGGSFVRVDISGGGTKALTGTMNVSEAVNFLTSSVNATNTVTANKYTKLDDNAGILTTNILTPTTSVILLADRASTNSNNGAQLNGETDLSYLRGFVRTTRQGVLVAETRTYGNMGMTLTFTGTNSPGNVDVTRNTVEAYAPVSGRFGIRRIFGVRPGDQTTNSNGLTADMIFHYRYSETQNLNGADIRTPGTGNIPEDQLTIFYSSNSGGAFSLIGRDGPVDQTNKNVTKTGVTKFATFTLGSTVTPLPVRLMAFDAKRIGSDALVTWQTASEENSKGYEVQVSTNSTEYRTLASIPSASPNTTQVTNYSYVDKEANKTGKRYYRLHQLDLDGKDAFFAPTVVSFDGKAPASNFVAYPNPLNAGNELHVALQSAATGTAKLLVTDMTGRTLQQQNVALTGSLTDASVAGMGDLKAGMYLVKIILPSGEVKNLKVVKQ